MEEVSLTIVLWLKIIFILSVLLKLLSPITIPKIKLGVKISRLVYYWGSLLLFLYWFNPWGGIINLNEKEKDIVFSFTVIEIILKMYPNLAQ